MARDMERKMTDVPNPYAKGPQSDVEPVTLVAQAIHAETKAWRLKTDGHRYLAVKDHDCRELAGDPTREEAEAAFGALVDEECARAAISTYRAALAQSDAEPVAWQWRRRYSNDDWSIWAITVKRSQNEGSQNQCEYRALYTTPPRPAERSGK
jgi:hypothetical protein